MKRIVFHILGRLLQLEAGLMLAPLLVSFLYQESIEYWGSFLISILILLVIGSILAWKKPQDAKFYTREGMVIVSLGWFLLSLFGALPLFLTKTYPSMIDAFFEIVSGFTTTGASVHANVEGLSHSINFWRTFTHFIGGMGVLVFAMALFPQQASSIHMAKAEMPGPSFSKFVAKLSETARILYIIYVVMTAVLVVILMFLGMDLYDALCHSFGTAGTGGFGVKNASVGYYQSNAIELVIGIFMLLFGVNFNLYFLILVGKVKKALADEEMHWYIGFITLSTFAIFLQTFWKTGISEKGLLDSFFTVSSIITTTGFSTVDFDTWPLFSRGILLLLMFVGAMAGSTGGGLKVSRVAILLKSSFLQMRTSSNPNRILTLRFNKTSISDKQLQAISAYFGMYVLLFIISTMILLTDLPNLISALSAVAATINNIGPGFDVVGPTQNFGSLSIVSKITLSICMIVGRLEIWPVLVLFSPSSWSRTN